MNTAESVITPAPAAKPVRKHKDGKAAKVRALTAKGMTPAEIATKLKIKPQYVYAVKAYDRKKQQVKGTFIKPAKRIKTQPSLWQRIKALFV